MSDFQIRIRRFWWIRVLAFGVLLLGLVVNRTRSLRMHRWLLRRIRYEVWLPKAGRWVPLPPSLFGVVIKRGRMEAERLVETQSNLTPSP